jgi:hypothetical protein
MTEPIDRIEAALGRLGAEHEPPVGWEAKVLAATVTATATATHTHIGHPEQGHTGKWWWLMVPAVAAAVAIVVAPRALNDSQLQLALTFDKGGSVVRGTLVQVGDIVHAIATGGGPSRAVWIYHGDALVAACPGAERAARAVQCHVSDTSTIADLTLSSIGEYVIVAQSSTSPISKPTGKFDVDIAHARDAGAIEKIERLTVR